MLFRLTRNMTGKATIIEVSVCYVFLALSCHSNFHDFLSFRLCCIFSATQKLDVVRSAISLHWRTLITVLLPLSRLTRLIDLLHCRKVKCLVHYEPTQILGTCGKAEPVYYWTVNFRFLKTTTIGIIVTLPSEYSKNSNHPGGAALATTAPQVNQN